jgi:hypothetical protein
VDESTGCAYSWWRRSSDVPGQPIFDDFTLKKTECVRGSRGDEGAAPRRSILALLVLELSHAYLNDKSGHWTIMHTMSRIGHCVEELGMFLGRPQ